MRDLKPLEQKGQDVPWTGPVERGSVAALCPLGSRSPSSPALGVPFPILTPCLMPCPRLDVVLTSLTRIRAHTVCLITMSVSGHWGAMGSYPGSWQVSAFPGGWEGGGWRVRRWSTHQCPPAFQVLHTSIPAPPTMPASRTPQSQGLGSSQRWDMGLHPGAELCNSHLQQRCHWSGSHTRPEPGSGEEQPGPASISPTCAKTPPRGQQCGDSCRHLERGWRSWFSGGQLWGSTLWPPGELWVWLLSPLPSPGSWHCPCPWSACWAGCCGRQRGPVFNCLSFQTSATAGPSQ